MAPARSHRRATRPVYPGVVPFLLGGLLGFFAWRAGYRLPWHASMWVKLLLQAGVVLLMWRTWKAFRGALQDQLRLFKAQAMISYAVALQAFILLLQGG